MILLRACVSVFLFSAPLAAFCQTESFPLSFGETIPVYSGHLSETRTVNIYLPEGYDAADSIFYPVIFIPDGGAEEDFFHIAGMIRYISQPWIARIPKTIVVGIENTKRRRDLSFSPESPDYLEEMGFNAGDYGGSASYIAFLEKELIPLITGRYKVSGHRTIIGESLAGLLASEILLKHPHLFNEYIIISPSLWWDHQSLLLHAQSLLSRHLKQQVRVYIGAADREESEEMYLVAEKLYGCLAQHEKTEAYFDYLPEELHSTILHQAAYNAFRILYPKTTYSR